MAKPDTAEIERLAAAAPSAPNLAKANAAEIDKRNAAALDRQARTLCIQEASRACAAGGYEVTDIMRLAMWFHAFMTNDPAAHISSADTTGNNRTKP